MSTIKAAFPEKLKCLFTPSRYKIIYGGRGSGKSWGIARALIILAAATNIRILCAREYQNSIQDSVHKLLSDQIDDMGFSAHFQITQFNIRNPFTGSEFFFAGLHQNVTRIKSFEGINLVWVEEAESVTKSSWDTLIPTIRTSWYHPFIKDFVSSEIVVSFNPSEETDNTYQRFVINTPPDAILQQVNFCDNPFFPIELLKESEYMKRMDFEDWSHIWMGACTKKSAAQVLRGKWRVEAFEPGDDWDGPYFGNDFGFSVDPSAGIKCWVHESRLWIEHEAYGMGVENDDLPELFSQIPGLVDHVSRADCSRPETISHCRRHGLPRMTACEKWPGSVQDGINYIRGTFEEIIIHPRCVATAQEARLWSYKVDKNTGDVLPVLEDKHNHLMDALRYAIGPLIKNKVAFVKKWWRYCTDAEKIANRVTVKFVTVTMDDIDEGGSEMGAVYQCWGVEGFSGVYLLGEQADWGSLPVIMANAKTFWNDHQVGNVRPSELWVDNRAMGPTMIKQLRQLTLPAREWNPEDKLVADPQYRAKQTAVHLADGRVFVPPGSAVITEIEGLSTNAMSLAVMIWQQRGGGRGPIPADF